MNAEPTTAEIERAQVLSLRRLNMIALDIATRLDIPLGRVQKHLDGAPRRHMRGVGVVGPVHRNYHGRV